MILSSTNARYNICVQGVKGYVTVAKTTRICDESVYEKHVDSLTSNLAMEAVTKRCEKFDEKTCVTDTLSNVWSQIQSGGQQLGDTISKNFNEAVDSLSTFAKNVGSQIQAQNITERLKESATTLQKSLTERGREFGDMVSGQSLNRYSLVDGDRTGAESSQSFSFNSFINSLVPSIEVVEKSRPEPVAQGTEHVQKMFNSLISIFKPSNAASVQQPIQEPKSKATVGDNPYNVIQ